MGATMRLFRRVMGPILTFGCALSFPVLLVFGPRKRRSFYTLREAPG